MAGNKFNNNKELYKSNNGNSEDISLMFKDHKDFFDGYYDLRTRVNNLLAGFLLDVSLRKDLLKNLFQLINWASNYIKDLDDLRTKYFKLTEIKGEKLNTSEGKKKFYDDILVIWDVISNDNQLFELLPKPDVKIHDSEEEKFWKEEDHIGLKQIKKGFIDILSIKKD